MAEGDPGRSTLAAFAGAVLIGGGNFVAVSFSNEDLEPNLGAALRFAAATLIFFLIAAIAKIPMPKGRALLGAVLYGVLGFGAAYAFLYYALTGLDAGTASIIMASVPLVTLFLAVLHKQERWTLRGVLGGLLAIAGIGLLSTGELGGSARPIHLVAAFLGVVAVAESTVIIKGFPRAHPVATNAAGMAAGTLLLVILSIAFGEEWALPATGRTWLVLTWLIVVGSVGLFVLFLYVVERWTASASVYAITLMPVVAVTLGALLKDEDVGFNVVGGGILVLAAVYVGAIRPPKDTYENLIVGTTDETVPRPTI